MAKLNVNEVFNFHNLETAKSNVSEWFAARHSTSSAWHQRKCIKGAISRVRESRRLVKVLAEQERSIFTCGQTFDLL